MLLQLKPKTEREWQGVLGLNAKNYSQLCIWCMEDYKILNGYNYEQMLEKFSLSKTAKIQSINDLIFYTLVVLKSGITFDFASFLMSFDQSRGHRQFVNGLNLLHYVLDIRGYLPLRNIETLEVPIAIGIEVQFTRSEVLIIDATEQRIQRPQDVEFQKETYSGKKKANTVKAMIISTLDKYIHYISHCYIGKTHDFTILKEEFNPALDWFNGYTVRLDLAYLGFKNDYPNAISFLPNKKPKGKELTVEQKEENRIMASQRIAVEHSIAGIKRFDILNTISRFHNFDTYDKVLAVCAGLWNFYLDMS